MSITIQGVSLLERLKSRQPGLVRALQSVAEDVPNILGDRSCQISIETASLISVLRGIPICVIVPEIRSSSDRRQLSFLGGRLCAELALLACGAQSVAVGTRDGRAPLWPADWIGSISHIDSSAIAVVARPISTVAVGIDIETILGYEEQIAVTSVCLTSAEQDLVAHSGDRKATVLTLIFSAKEAYYKAFSHLMQRALEFKQVEVVAIDFESGVLCLRLSANDVSGLKLPQIAARFIVQNSVVRVLVAQRSAGELM